MPSNFALCVRERKEKRGHDLEYDDVWPLPVFSSLREKGGGEGGTQGERTGQLYLL